MAQRVSARQSIRRSPTGVNLSSTIDDANVTPRALHRRCNAGAFRTPVTLADARRCRPTQLSSLQKAHSCDRRHIPNAIAELVFYSSIVPPLCGSSDVPPTPRPRSRGALFSPLDFLCREPPSSPGRQHVTASGTISRFPHLLSKEERRELNRSASPARQEGGAFLATNEGTLGAKKSPARAGLVLGLHLKPAHSQAPPRLNCGARPDRSPSPNSCRADHRSNQSEASHTAPTMTINGPSTKMYFAPPTWPGAVNRTQQTYSPVSSRAVARIVLIAFFTILPPALVPSLGR